MKENDSKLIGGFGSKGSTGQYRTQNRIYDSEVSAPTINTGFNPNFVTRGGQMEDNDLRIRKLTPKECGRLMGVKDADIDLIAKKQSDSSQYHLYGDSIVTTCLMGIFGELLGINWKEHYKPEEWWINQKEKRNETHNIRNNRRD